MIFVHIAQCVYISVTLSIRCDYPVYFYCNIYRGSRGINLIQNAYQNETYSRGTQSNSVLGKTLLSIQIKYTVKSLI